MGYLLDTISDKNLIFSIEFVTLACNKNASINLDHAVVVLVRDADEAILRPHAMHAHGAAAGRRAKQRLTMPTPYRQASAAGRCVTLRECPVHVVARHRADEVVQAFLTRKRRFIRRAAVETGVLFDLLRPAFVTRRRHWDQFTRADEVDHPFPNHPSPTPILVNVSVTIPHTPSAEIKPAVFALERLSIPLLRTVFAGRPGDCPPRIHIQCASGSAFHCDGFVVGCHF